LLWSRKYNQLINDIDEETNPIWLELEEVLNMMNAKHLVIAHSIQDEIKMIGSKQQLIKIDIGMSRAFVTYDIANEVFNSIDHNNPSYLPLKQLQRKLKPLQRKLKQLQTPQEKQQFIDTHIQPLELQIKPMKLMVLQDYIHTYEECHKWTKVLFLPIPGVFHIVHNRYYQVVQSEQYQNSLWYQTQLDYVKAYLEDCIQIYTPKKARLRADKPRYTAPEQSGGTGKERARNDFL